MAAKLAADDGYGGRMTAVVSLSCFVAATGGIIYGYDLGISGGVTSMDSFLKKFFPEVYAKMKEAHVSNYCRFDSQLLTAFTSSLYVSGLFASLVASSVTQARGRKVSMVISGCAFFAGSLLGGFAVNVYMLILGRILLGVGVAFSNQSVPLYLSEMAPPRHRGGITNAFELFVAIGVLSANLINFATQKIHGGWGWRISLAAAAVPATFLTLGGLFLPETPSSLLQRGIIDRHKAKEKLQKIRGTVDVENELNDILNSSGYASKNRTCDPLRKILSRRYRPQLVMAIAIPFFQKVTGINVVTFYAPVIFRSIGLGESASLMSAVATGVVATCCTVVAMLTADRIGRRPLFLIGGVLMFVSNVAIAATMATEFGDVGGMGRGYAYLVLILTCVYVAGFGLSWGPLAWLVPSEIFPLEIRSVGQSIVVGVGFVFIFVFAQSFLALLCHLRYGTFVFFAGWVAVMTVFVFTLLPETKDVPIERMERIWADHWFWKSFAVEETERGVMIVYL